MTWLLTLLFFIMCCCETYADLFMTLMTSGQSVPVGSLLPHLRAVERVSSVKVSLWYTSLLTNCLDFVFLYFRISNY